MRLMLASAFVLAAMQAAPALPKPARAPRSIDGKQLAVTISQSATAAAPGSRVSLFVDVFPKPKMHVYAPEQSGGYIRIELDLDESDRFSARPPVFPRASNYYFAPLDETFKVFNAPFRVRQDITVAKTATTPVTITGTLRYQACDDQVCYRPDELKVAWTIAPQPLVPR